MQWEQIMARVAISLEGNPHMYWDYIIPDGGESNPYFREAKAVFEPQPLNGQYVLKSKVILSWPRQPTQRDDKIRPISSQGSTNLGLNLHIAISRMRGGLIDYKYLSYSGPDRLVQLHTEIIETLRLSKNQLCVWGRAVGL
jgi:hypothetical protein